MLMYVLFAESILEYPFIFHSFLAFFRFSEYPDLRKLVLKCQEHVSVEISKSHKFSFITDDAPTKSCHALPDPGQIEMIL